MGRTIKKFAKGTEPKRKMVYAPANVLKDIKKEAKKQGLKENVWINLALVEKLNRDGCPTISRYALEDQENIL